MKVVAKKLKRKNRGFTKGKIYDVIEKGKYSFSITNDLGYTSLCLYRDCIHIGGNWTIIGNPAIAVPNG